MVTYLTIGQIIKLNRRTVETHGGNFVPPANLLNEESLHYLIEAVAGEMFGEPMYPTIADKAALYLHSIVSNHVFQDGNKRTGIGAALAFCRLNGYRVMTKEEVPLLEDGIKFPHASEQLVYNFTMEVASGRYTLEEVKAWFAAYLVEIEG